MTGAEGEAGDQVTKENCLNQYTKKWSTEQITLILDYLKEWNTNSRHSKIVHTLFQSLIEVFGVANFLRLPYLSDLLSSLSNYSERHFQRVDRLNESIYLLEYLDSESSLSPNDQLNK
jgi:U3 small nucleolar RNA-associated protein 13